MVLLFLIAGQVVLAETGVEKATNGLETTAKGGYGSLPAETNLPTIIGGVVGAALALVGVVFFLLILYAGFNWMMAQGKEEQVTKAKDTIFAAVLGLIVILGAYAITTLAARLFSDALGMK